MENWEYYLKRLESRQKKNGDSKYRIATPFDRKNNELAVTMARDAEIWLKFEVDMFEWFSLALNKTHIAQQIRSVVFLGKASQFDFYVHRQDGLGVLIETKKRFNLNHDAYPTTILPVTKADWLRDEMKENTHIVNWLCLFGYNDWVLMHDMSRSDYCRDYNKKFVYRNDRHVWADHYEIPITDCIESGANEITAAYNILDYVGHYE